MLRDYQQNAIDLTYLALRAAPDTHPCLVLPTGSGKSWIIAALCKDVLEAWPDRRILMLTHQKELISQDAEKLLMLWPDAPLGIYNAGLDRKEIEPITFGSVQSLRGKADLLGKVNMIIVDEAHTINHNNEGQYRTLINELTQINPALRVVGLTATPWRLGHGDITEGEALFDELIEPVSIIELVNKGYLAPLRSKSPINKLSTEGVKKRGGEYIEKELQAAVDQHYQNQAAVREIIEKAEGRKSWILFCTVVQHSLHIAEELRNQGIIAETVTGETPQAERDAILAAFKAGAIQAITNANVLTTGFDAPNIDLVAFLRPTMSPSLYMQMAGRGMRLKDHTDHCLVLDFAGLVSTHGPITDVVPPTKKGAGEGKAPVKVCDHCFELVHLSAKICPTCGEAFPPPEPKPVKLHNDDIMGGAQSMKISSWRWDIQNSRKTGQPMFVVRFYSSLHLPPITEYLVVAHEGWAGEAARIKYAKYAQASNCHEAISAPDMNAAAEVLNSATPPKKIYYKRNGKYHEIVKRSWKSTD